VSVAFSGKQAHLAGDGFNILEQAMHSLIHECPYKLLSSAEFGTAIDAMLLHPDDFTAGNISERRWGIPQKV
jgi:hypothetical protein